MIISPFFIRSIKILDPQVFLNVYAGVSETGAPVITILKAG